VEGAREVEGPRGLVVSTQAFVCQGPLILRPSFPSHNMQAHARGHGGVSHGGPFVVEPEGGPHADHTAPQVSPPSTTHTHTHTNACIVCDTRSHAMLTSTASLDIVECRSSSHGAARSSLVCACR
jgi:hypothetical protein